MTRIKHKYNEELEAELIKMEDDEYFEWLKTNEIEYEKTLLEVIKKEKFDVENKE